MHSPQQEQQSRDMTQRVHRATVRQVDEVANRPAGICRTSSTNREPVRRAEVGVVSELASDVRRWQERCSSSMHDSRSDPNLLARHTHGQGEISPSRAYCSRQADESDGGGQRVEQVLSMEIADSSAQNEGDERKEDVGVEENWSEARRNQLAMRR